MDAAAHGRAGWRSWAVSAGLVVCVGVVIMVGVSMFLPIGGRPGVILTPGDRPSTWRLGVARGVAWYRREAPPVLRGQQLMWEPTALGSDPFGPWHRGVSWWRVYWEERESPSQVVEARVPVWPAALLAGLLCAVWVRGRVRAFERHRRGECEGCGFPLTPAGVCAECGRHWPVAAAERATPASHGL